MATLAAFKGLSIGSCLVAGGALSAVSVVTIPALLSAPYTVAPRQFRIAIQRTQYGAPYFAASALLHGLVAYRLHSLGSRAWGRWAAAAALVATVIPWSAAVLHPVTERLLGIAGTQTHREGGTEVGTTTEALLRKWSSLNAARSLLALAAGSVGLWALLDEA